MHRVEQIEEVLERHPGVLDSSVIGIPHPYKVEVPKAYIVLKNDYKPTVSVKNSIKKYTFKGLRNLY